MKFMPPNSNLSSYTDILESPRVNAIEYPFFCLLCTGISTKLVGMKRRYTFYLLLSLSCAVAQPASAFWSFGNDEKKDKEPKKEETGTWSKLVSDAKGKLKEFEEDLGNAETPTWDGLKESAGEAMDQFAKDGKGFDIMKRATKKASRKIERIKADEDSALTGRFYDLKQPVDGKSAPLHR